MNTAVEDFYSVVTPVAILYVPLKHPVLLRLRNGKMD